MLVGREGEAESLRSYLFVSSEGACRLNLYVCVGVCVCLFVCGMCTQIGNSRYSVAVFTVIRLTL